MSKIFVPLVLDAMLLTLVFPAQAQQAKRAPKIGYLTNARSAPAAFMQGLRDLGYVEGKNVVIEFRTAGGKFERYPELAADLVRAKVDVIVAGGSGAVTAAKNATSTIPVVMASVNDPIALGLVASLAHPGGNITGISNLSPELSGKRLELIKEVIPKATRVVVLAYRVFCREIDDLSLMRGQSRGLNLYQSVYNNRDNVEAGGLMSYGPDQTDVNQRVAAIVDKILKGRKPTDIPVEQPRKFELVFNLKTAKQIGLIIPPNVLMRADRVIR
jgi:putative ABC transport system substrate-binding protein